MKFLNLGCGARFHKDWVNIDFVSPSPEVIAHDLSLGIPFPDNEFDVVYHSHVLEHFSKNDAKLFLQECRRVLKPKGVLRVVVPDLEIIVNQYIHWRELARQGDPLARLNYDWIMLEMYDQCVRNVSGGHMAAYLRQPEIPNEGFVRQRIGYAFDLFRQAVPIDFKPPPNPLAPNSTPSLFRYLLAMVNSFRKKLLHPLAVFYWRERRYRKVGKFRISGEPHLWMYDSYSLSTLIRDCGFVNPVVCAANQSSILNWSSFCLDTEPDDTVYKADSLFMEATK
jgi:predicted SAM-dependent methyltransferase